MSKVVFVGNVPYNMNEDQLIDVFKSVGQVVGFRLVFDRDTGKAKGYGFCEFADHETALSAVRNLNNQDVGGRPLRIDIADSDPFLEGKTTVRGEILDGGYPGPAEPRSGWNRGGRADPEAFMASLPPGKPVHPGTSVLDSITATLANMPPPQLLEILAQMKAFIITHPEQARILLQKQPQLSYALFQALLLHKIVPAEILSKMQNTPAAPPPSASRPPRAPLPQQTYPPPPPQQAQAPPPHNMYMQPPPTYPPAPGPPPASMYSQPPAAMPPPPVPAQAQAPPGGGYYRPPPPPMHQPQPQVAGMGDVDEAQRAMIMQVLALPQETINTLPPEQKASIMSLRQQFMGMTQ